MADNEVYEEGTLILVEDYSAPLNPIPAVVQKYEPTTARVRVKYRNSGYVGWIDASRIIGRDKRARRGAG